MPSEVIWLPCTSRDVARLRDFLKSKNPRAAQRAAKYLLEGVMIVQENPGAGAPVDDLLGYRDLKLSFGSGEYIIRYREESQRVLMVRVRHSKEEGF